MPESKKSYQTVFEFISAATQWIKKNEEESKFKYALTKMARKLNTLRERYQEEVEEINIEHCATDEKGVILRDSHGQYQYTKEELIKRNRAVNKLYRSEVEIQPHFVSEVPDNVTELEKEVFEGFVLPENTT